MEEISSKHHSFHYLDFDIFSKSIGFFYHDKERIGSIIGFILTLIYIIISITLFIFYALSTINKRDMKVHDSLLFQKEAPEMDINPDLFYFAFGVENYLTGFTRFIDETIYYPKVVYINKIKEGPNFNIIEERPLHFERCQEYKFGEDYQHLLVKGELNNSYCINDFNLTLAGNFKYDKLSYIKIGIYPCINTTENDNHCKPKDVINSFLSGTFISILAKDIGLEPSNYTHPYIPTFQDLYTTIDKKYFTEFCLFFGITEIQTDEGLFSEKLRKERYMNFVKTTQGIYSQDEEKYLKGSPICEVQIRMGDDIRIQKRTYMKMSEVLAITGGYMQLISTLFSIITFFINKLNNEIHIVNSIFDFYPKKNKIALKYKLQKIINTSQNTKNKPLPYYMQKNPNMVSDERNNTILDMSKHNLMFFHSIEKSSKSLKLINNFHQKKFNSINHKCYESDIKNNFFQQKPSWKREKDSSNDRSRNNKSKMTFLTYKNNNLNKSQLKQSDKLVDKIEQNTDELLKKKVKFNAFYYYCYGKFEKNQEDVKLFNMAISLYKQKMDIIYIFHIILLVEKLWKGKTENIKSDEEMVFQLKG